MSLTQRTFIGASWQFLAVCIQGVLQLLVLAILARQIQKSEFGIVALASIAINIAATLSRASVGPAVIQRRDLGERDIRAAFSLSVGIGAVGTALLWLAAPWIAEFLREPMVGTVLRWLSFSLLIGSLGVVAESLLERKLNYRRLMYANASAFAFGYAPVGVTMALLGFGVWSLVGATLVQNTLRTFVLLFSNPHPARPLVSSHELRPFLWFGGGVTLHSVFGMFGEEGLRAIVGRMVGIAPLGVYQVAYRLMDLPRQFVGGVLERVMFPAFSEVQDDRRRMARAYCRALGGGTLLMLPLSLGMLLAAPEIVDVVLGSAWKEAVLPLQLLLLQVPLRALVRMSDALVTATGEVYRMAARRLVYGLAVLIGALAGVGWGLPGVVIGLTAAVALNALLMVILSRTVLACGWIDIGRSLVPGLLVGGILAAGLGSLMLVLRNAVDSPALNLGLAVLFCAAVTLGIAWRLPRLIGEPGREMRARVSELLGGLAGSPSRVSGSG